MSRDEITTQSTARTRPTRLTRSGFGRWPGVVLAAIIVAGLIPFSATAQQAPAGHAEAQAIVGALYDGLLDAMKNAEKLGYAGRYKRLDPVIREVYDLPAMAKASLGGGNGAWGKLSEAQQKTLVDAFGRMSVATYAARFSSFDGQKFEVDGAQKGPRGTVLVLSRLVSPNGNAVKLNYLMIKRKTGWKVIDVFALGSISEIATKRSDYGAVMEREGFDSLITSINARVAEMEKQS